MDASHFVVQRSNVKVKYYRPMLEQLFTGFAVDSECLINLSTGSNTAVETNIGVLYVFVL